MVVHFVKEIITVLEKPDLCLNCNKSQNLLENTISEKISNGKTMLCTNCETLTIITNLNLRRVDLVSKKHDTIMLRDQYQIRKVR